MRKDYIAQWYEVREEQGISDRIHCFVHQLQEGKTDWYDFRHRDTDGIGMLATMRERLGYPPSTLPCSRDPSEPGFWHTRRSVRRLPRNNTPKRVHWNVATQARQPDMAEPEFRLLSPATVTALTHHAQQRGVSLASLMLASLNQTVFQQYLKPDSQAWWFYPVNIRNAANAHERSNLSSGFYLCLNQHSTAEQIHAQVKEKLTAKEHWWLWKMAHIGRWIGKPGVRWIYRRISRSQFYLGSFSYLGDWSLPLHTDHIIGVCGAGSANYPIATGITECNGHITLALKFHASISATQPPPPAAEPTLQQHCLTHWQHNLRSLIDHV